MCDKVVCVCVPISARAATQNEGGCRQGQCLPRKTKVDVAMCRACHVKQGGCRVAKCETDPSTSPDPAMCQKCHACRAKRQPSVRSTTTATSNEGGCRQVPHLPRETKADVAKCHPCHAKVPRRHAPRATKQTQARHQSQPSLISTTPAT